MKCKISEKKADILKFILEESFEDGSFELSQNKFMQILSAQKIQQKINRLAIEILESNFNEKEIYLLGINNNGLHFAQLLKNQLDIRQKAQCHLGQISLNTANPVAQAITVSLEAAKLKNKVLIIVDDVANTGRTILYAIQPILATLPKKIEIAVLVDRKHKSFPIAVDYVGLSLATTLKENIKVEIQGAMEEWSVSLL